MLRTQVASAVLSETNKNTGEMMKDYILLELANRWTEDAKERIAVDASEESKIHNATTKGERQAKRECADAIRMLVSLLGSRVTGN